MKKQMKLFTNMTKPFVLFVLLLTVGVGDAWGDTQWFEHNNNSHIYFNDATTQWVSNPSSETVVFLMGRDDNYGKEGAGSQAYRMSHIAHTKLFYTYVPTWATGTNDKNRYQFIAFRYANCVSNCWENWDGMWVTNRAKYENTKYAMTYNHNITGRAQYYAPTSSNENTAMDAHEPFNDYKYTAFLRTKESEDGGATYSSIIDNGTHNWKARFDFTGTYMVDAGSSGQSTIQNLDQNTWEDNGKTKYGYDQIPITGEVTFLLKSIDEGYEIEGWATENDTHPLWYLISDSDPTDVTFNISKTGSKDNEGVYVAFIRRKQYTVTFDRKGDFGTSTVTATAGGSAATSESKYNHGLEIVYTAHPATGYEVEGWYSDAACSISLNNGTNATYTVSSLEDASSAYVKFREKTFSVAFTNDGNGTVTAPNSTPQTVGQITGIDINASAAFGYQFNTWSSSTGGSFDVAGTANTKFYPTAATTVTANFARRYAYIEANFQVYDATRSTRTPVGNVNWKDDSRAIEMAYDGTNRRYYLHTYSTPAQLAERLNNADAYFYIKTTSSSSSTFTDEVSYYADGSSNQSLSSEGSANKKAVTTSSSANSFKFTGSDNGYVILYFDGTHVWYELEYGVTYEGNGNTGGTTPTDAAYYASGATVTVKADPDSWAKTGYSFGGWNTANDGSGSNYAAGVGTFTINANTTLYAKWTQDVTLDNTGYTTAGSTSVTLTYNSSTHAALTYPEKTGYTFNGWYTGEGGTGSLVINPSGVLQNSVSVSTTNYTDASGNWIYSGSAPTLYAKWTPNEYTVRFENLDADAGHKGSQDTTVTFNDTINMKGKIEVPSKTYYTFNGYWTSTDQGRSNFSTQLIDANGNWIKDVSPYTGNYDNTYATWILAADTVLYAKWSETLHAITIESGGNGTVSPASVNVGNITSSGAITATPNPGYHFRDWTLPDGGIVTTHEGTLSTNATIRIKATASGTITANFDPNTYTVHFENLDADAGHKGSIDTTVTFNDSINMKGPIEVPSKTNYTFGGYYISTDKGLTLTSIQIINANGNWVKDVSGYTGSKDGYAKWVCTGDTTLYAKWTEKTHTVTVQVSAGAYEGTPGTVQINSVVNEVTAGEVTWSDVLTPIANPGWKFKEWQETSNVDLDLLTYHRDYQTSGTNSMRIKATADDETITAVFEPRYALVGEIYNGSGEAGGMPGMSNYTVVFPPSDLTCTRNLLANTKYQVEIHDLARGANMGRSGCASGCVLEENTSLVMENQDNVVFLNTTGAGYYIFKITNINGSGNPTLTVLRPHQANFGRRRVDIDGVAHDDNTGGTLVVDTNSVAISSGAWITYGDTVQYTTDPASGYTQTWYTSSEYSGTFTAGGIWKHALTTTDNCYAQFTEKATSVTLSATNGQIKVGDTSSSETTCGVTTTRSLTAVPNDGYYFTGWSLSSSPDFQLDDKTIDTDAEVTLRGKGNGTAGTLTANFALRYSIKGTMNSEDWKTDHIVSNIETIGGKAIGYVDISLPANTSYEFAIYDLQKSQWLKNGSDKVYNMTNGNSYNWDFGTDKAHNCGITTAGAGTYRFMWNITDKTMSVIYPNFVIYRTGDMAEDTESATHTITSAVESYAGGTISEAIEFRMKVRELDKWYTLCLPFEVNKVCVWDEEDCAYYPIVPYYRSGGTLMGGHYIIRTPKTATDLAITEFGDWRDPTSADGYKPSKDTPYIIQWHMSYFNGKYISFFSATGQEIPSSMSEGTAPTESNVVNVCVNNSMAVGSATGAYMLENDYGDGAWLRDEDASKSRTILPFECYVLANTETTGRYLVIRRDMTITETPTGFETGIPKMQQTNKVIINGQLFIIRDNKMYNIYGKEVQ